MNVNLLKQDKGFTGADITIAVISFIIFLSVITSLFYNVYIMNQKSKRLQEASQLITDIFEIVEKNSYAQINTNSESSFITDVLAKLNPTGTAYGSNNVNFNKGSYHININVVNYNTTEGNTDKEDIIKTIKVTVEYYIGKKVEANKQVLEMKMLKIKE